jgi:transposase-like protein
VISDAHAGLKASISRVLAGASWQRCKVHLMRNILGTVASASKDVVAATVRTICAQPTATACQAQLHEVVGGCGNDRSSGDSPRPRSVGP